VFRTDLSWPALVAAGLGISGFTVPTYGGPLGGLPFNLEGVLRRLQQDFGDELNPLEKFVELPVALQRLCDGNEDYWERGEGRKPARVDLRYENLGIYGWGRARCLVLHHWARCAAGNGQPTGRCRGVQARERQ